MKVLVIALALVATLGIRPAVAAGTALDADAEAAAVARIEAAADGPSPAALTPALAAYHRALTLGLVANPALLTVIDYTRPSTEPRLWVLDLGAGRVLHRELVAHGRGSGDNVATAFSNEEGSLKSSLGLFVTDRTYQGQNGYSLRLRGLDPGLNDRALARAIVMHGARYVNSTIAAQLGRLGRSWGCPALRVEVARTIIDLIKEGTVIYAHGPRPAARG